MADSKVTPHGGGKATYDYKKIRKLGDVAIAIAGVGYLDNTAKVLTDLIRDFKKLNPKISLYIIAKEICEQSSDFLQAPESRFNLILADSKSMYFIQAHVLNNHAEARYDKVVSAIAGIEDINFMPSKDMKTTKEYGAYLKQVVKLNKGLHVGGRTQEVILKK